MTNRLAEELSPYLLQHAENPVDWWPWGAAALEKARREEKPIFLSIGYASCHWCHVMAHESFENPSIAEQLNRDFVSIKVDREERPDLDMIYMEAVQLLTGRGGWPMSMFLTPEAKPFFGGTYWPDHAMGGMPGFDQVLEAVADAWRRRRGELLEQAEKMTVILREHTAPGEQGKPLESARPAEGFDLEKVSTAAENSLRRSFDSQAGGFGPPPKFPQPLALRWLLHRGRQTGNEELLRIATVTLDRMAEGGIFDHLGGGFHRYTVDGHWLVPHFEKMLYDNAMLASCYLEGWQATGMKRYAEVVRQTLDYLLRDMRDPVGGFYSSEDADSEGEEGKFYLWSPEEIEAVLGSDVAKLFCQVYDVTEAGNFEGRNILHRTRSLEVEAKILGRDPAELGRQLAIARRQLLAARARRVRPGRDDKVLVNWNSLAIDAFAQAGAAMSDERYAQAAGMAADFVFDHLRRDGRLLHCWRAGRAAYNAYLDDHAGLANALLTLYEKSGQPNRLGQAVLLADTILEQFSDGERGGFFYTSADHEPLIVRKKDLFDNPVPSGNALTVLLLLRLHAITHRDEYRAAAHRALGLFAATMEEAPAAMLQMLLAAGVSAPQLAKA
mgnify:FL=1